MIILGSTGSIGTQALELARHFELNIEALVCGQNIELLNQQIREFRPKFIVINSKQDSNRVIKNKDSKLFFGENGILQMLENAKSNVVLNALVGFSGLAPSLKAQDLGKILALANKESLVVGGFLLDCARIFPIDSEHFSLQELLKKECDIKRLIITASGGALRDVPLNELSNQTKTSALNHPNWAMGEKITIDSATMANKLFEILEAFWLFKISNIDALIERTSRIHAMIETNNNAILAHIASNDMKIAIHSAINSALLAAKPNEIDIFNRSKLQAFIPKNLDLSALNLAFYNIDCARYPLWALKDSLLQTPKLGIILNAANDILNAKFLKNEIKFGEIASGILRIVDNFSHKINVENLDNILELNKEIKSALQG